MQSIYPSFHTPSAIIMFRGVLKNSRVNPKHGVQIQFTLTAARSLTCLPHYRKAALAMRYEFSETPFASAGLPDGYTKEQKKQLEIRNGETLVLILCIVVFIIETFRILL